jgi:hypothetical protein
MRFLIADQKQQCVNPCEQLSQIAFDDATFLTRVIIGDASWIYSYNPETQQQSSKCKRPNSPRLKKASQVKSKVNRKLIIFFDIKNLSRQAKQSTPHTTVTFYEDCVRMCEDFTPNSGNKRTGCCIITTHTPSHTSFHTR